MCVCVCVCECVCVCVVCYLFRLRTRHIVSAEGGGEGGRQETEVKVTPS